MEPNLASKYPLPKVRRFLNGKIGGILTKSQVAKSDWSRWWPQRIEMSWTKFLEYLNKRLPGWTIIRPINREMHEREKHKIGLFLVWYSGFNGKEQKSIAIGIQTVTI